MMRPTALLARFKRKGHQGQRDHHGQQHLNPGLSKFDSVLSQDLGRESLSHNLGLGRPLGIGAMEVGTQTAGQPGAASNQGR
jgi:hypothetical protein